ncbi:SDR family NAD(P)-dependent oxidoreductase [Streptomyces sp. 8L]|uniref:SDR family NAD(P)-dependent oxidoreductase n=1 Tax=Streptomyces sp. 8L TaxID=2877242 RepID=UPI001CD774AE|nr:SDR family NAD(P)-dependent oxidoreductase [Streptomyces sp. 8L]MCA1218031.1 SDR family NAD(P)-dependent oxidoreductase [Streptomyces sp. 8L]
MTSRLTSTVALVTGASSGIGRATALRLAEEGAAVALVARRKDRVEELARLVTDRGGRALVVPADVTDAAGAAAAVGRTVEHFGRLDILVNAAGVMLNGDSLLARLEEWDRMVDVNVKGVMYVVKAALPHLLDAAKSADREVADVINISSVAGRAAAPTVAIYNATKFGVTAATEAWRQEYAAQNLRFSVIEPGAVETELFGHQQEHAQQVENQRFDGVEKLHPEDIADAVAYIATGPRRRAVNEIVIRPTDQSF